MSGMWARCLVDSWAHSSRQQFVQIAATARREFESSVGHYIREREAAGYPLAWYELEKMGDGAYATFLGVTLDADGRWFAAAVGDSCVFQIRNGVRMASFPMSDPSDFDSSPVLLRSLGRSARAQFHAGEWMPDDTFVLCTDAFAQWLLTHEAIDATATWHEVLDLPTDSVDVFTHRVDELRAQSRLKNDDVTLLRVDIFG